MRHLQQNKIIKTCKHVNMWLNMFIESYINVVMYYRCNILQVTTVITCSLSNKFVIVSKNRLNITKWLMNNKYLK